MKTGLCFPVRVVLLLGLTLTLAGCNSLGSGPGLTGFGPSAGGTIGRREHPRVVAAYGGVYRNKKLENLLGDVTSRLVAVSSNPRQKYRVTVLNSPVVNAFALPGGYLYVTRGLLALANDTSEVAAVLSHEMAHVTENHAFQRRQRARQAKLVNRVVTDVIADDEQGQIALASAQVSLASFSRAQEIEADRIGVNVMSLAGLDPYSAARFLTSMGRYSRFRAASLSNSADSPNFLASHPATPQRISTVLEVARSLGPNASTNRETEAYLTAIDGMTFGDDPAEGYVRARAYLHPKLGFSFELPHGYTLENTSEAVLAADKRGTAMRFDGVQIPAQQTLADYMASGWVNGLIASTIHTRRIDGLEAATASAEAKGWRFEIAIVRLRGATYRFIFANAQNSDSLKADAEETLGSFRRLGRIEQARLNPLSIDIVRVQRGDTIASLSGKMRGVDRRKELFLILNGLQPSAEVKVGSFVKIVVD